LEKEEGDFYIKHADDKADQFLTKDDQSCQYRLGMVSLSFTLLQLI